MFKCIECGYVFEEPKNYSEDLTPGGVFEGGSFIKHYKGCPKCQGEYIEYIDYKEEFDDEEEEDDDY